MTHQVGQLHHALLDGLQVVAGVGQLQQHEHVGHAGHRGLALADADGLDDDDVVAGGLAHQHRLARLLGHAAQRAAGGAGADEGALVAPTAAPCASCRRGSSRPTTLDDGSTASTATRWPLLDQEQAQRLDEGALADARHAGDAEAERAAGVRQQRVQQLVGARAVVGARRLEQRDRLGHARGAAPAPAARARRRHQRLVGGCSMRRAQRCCRALRICSSTSLALAGIGVPGP